VIGALGIGSDGLGVLLTGPDPGGSAPRPGCVGAEHALNGGRNHLHLDITSQINVTGFRCVTGPCKIRSAVVNQPMCTCVASVQMAVVQL